MSTPPPPAAASLRAFKRVAKRLEPDGWLVKMERCGSSCNIIVDHELSSSAVIGFEDSDVDRQEFVERWLGQREFSVIHESPLPIAHGSLIAGIRSAGQANQWNRDVVTVIARVLRHEDLLTDAEAEWLEAAGPAWTEVDT